MKTISKTFNHWYSANNFYLQLCDHYDSVKLIESPRFSESGVYTWECCP